MPIRVDGAVPDTDAGGTPPTRRSRSRWVVTIVAVLAAVVVGLVIGVSVVRAPGGADPTNQQPQPSGQGSSGSQAPRVVEALPRSEIVAGDGGISRVYELRTGYGKSTLDAVEAVINFTIVDNGPAYYNQAHYEAIQAYMFASPAVRAQIGYRQSAVDAIRKQYGVNSLGQPLTAGKPDPTKKIWDAAYPQYGAYQIVERSADQVRVKIWTPIVYGVDYADATDTTNVKINWIFADKTVAWIDGDWRQVANVAFPDSSVPKPADPQQVVTSYAERASLLGTDEGWTLPANAVDTDTPALQLPGK